MSNMIGKLAQVTRGAIHRSGQDKAEISGQSPAGEVSDSVRLGVESESEKTGWVRRRHKISIEDKDGNPSLDFQVKEEDGEGYVIVTDSDEQGHQAQVKVPVGPLNAVARHFDPDSPFAMLPQFQAKERVEVEREGREVSIKVQGEGRTTQYNFSRWNFNVGNY